MIRFTTGCQRCLHCTHAHGTPLVVTAFDYATPAPLDPAAGTTDLLVFPGAKLYRGLPLTQLPNAVAASLPGGAADATAATGLPPPECMPGLTLLVCCHVCAGSGAGKCVAVAAAAAGHGWLRCVRASVSTFPRPIHPPPPPAARSSATGAAQRWGRRSWTSCSP